MLTDPVALLNLSEETLTVDVPTTWSSPVNDPWAAIT